MAAKTLFICKTFFVDSFCNIFLIKFINVEESTAQFCNLSSISSQF